MLSIRKFGYTQFTGKIQYLNHGIEIIRREYEVVVKKTKTFWASDAEFNSCVDENYKELFLELFNEELKHIDDIEIYLKNGNVEAALIELEKFKTLYS